MLRLRRIRPWGTKMSPSRKGLKTVSRPSSMDLKALSVAVYETVHEAMCKQQDCGWGCVWTAMLCMWNKWKFKGKMERCNRTMMIKKEQREKIVTPGGGKEGQFPPNFGQRNWANAAASTPSQPTPNQPKHFVLSAQVPNTPGCSGVLIGDSTNLCHLYPKALISKGFQNFQKGKIPTFMDSGASNTMFVSKDVFTGYKPITPCIGESAKAENGNFEIA